MLLKLKQSGKIQLDILPNIFRLYTTVKPYFLFLEEVKLHCVALPTAPSVGFSKLLLKYVASLFYDTGRQCSKFGRSSKKSGRAPTSHRPMSQAKVRGKMDAAFSNDGEPTDDTQQSKG